MKNKNIIIIVLIVIVVLLSFMCLFLYLKNEYNDEFNDDRYENNNHIENNQNGSTTPENKNYISSDSALQIALDSLKINKTDIHDYGVELENKYGTAVYEIDFKYDYYEYEFYIDATTGDILHSFKEWD